MTDHRSAKAREYRTSSTARGYNYRWQKARETFLKRAENVLCRKCSERGLVTIATVVDHIIPHKQDQALFWDSKNWQPLCAPCHNRDKQAEERGGKAKQPIGLDGWPV